MVVSVEEYLDGTETKSGKVVINLEYDGKTSYVRSLVAMWPTQSVYQCIYCITNPPSEEEVPNTDCIIAVFPGTNKNDKKPYPLSFSFSLTL